MDINLYYTEMGRENPGVPIIFLHGNGGNSSSFFYLFTHYAKTRRVIAIDTRGHGRSPRGDGEFTLSRFRDDLHGFMVENNIPKADLIGYSDGGNIALLFALAYPEMVNSMVLAGANLFPKGLEDKDMRWIRDTWKKSKKALRRNPQNVKALKTYELMCLMVNEPNISPESLSKINCPALVIVGDRDAIKPEHSKLIADSLPDGKLVTIKGGHDVVKSNSGDFIKATDDFYLYVLNKSTR